MARRGLALVIGMLLLVTACTGGSEEAADASGDDVAAEPMDTVTDDMAVETVAPTSVEDEGEGFAGDGGSEDSGDERAAVPVAERSGDRIIKEGTMTIDLSEDGFRVAFERVVSTARTFGGEVVSSTTTTTEEGATSGTVTVRVPVDSYEDLLVSAGEVGTVRSQDISSQDVTAEFVDTEARLRHEQAQEAFYLGLLEEAAGVPDAIAVQQQLESIQERIEQLRGRLNVLEDRTSFSTLTVQLVEPNTPSVLTDGDDGPSIAAYIGDARTAFITVVGWLIVLAGALAPLVVPLLLAALAWRLFRRPATLPAGAPNE